MGYDYDISGEPLYTSYNHGWAFYEYLDKKKGLRWLYGKTGRQTIKRLETVLECLEHLDGWEHDFPDGQDGWSINVANAYYFAERALKMAKVKPKGIWGGD